MTEIVDGVAVEEPGMEIEPATQAHTTLFATNDPVEVVEAASKVAAALKDVLRSQQMLQNIQGKEYVLVAGYQLLGSMLGVVPVVTWTRQLEDGWEARVEARTLDGRVVGAAEAMCTTRERMWAKRDPYALRSMAQTRATSKALRGPLGFVVTLAGYEATPAEEMPTDAQAPVARDVLSQEQYDHLTARVKELGPEVGPAIHAWLDERGVSAAKTVVPRLKTLSPKVALDLQKFLAEQTPAADVMPVPEELS